VQAKRVQLVRRPASTSEIESLIVAVRGAKVLLDTDLARLYGVSTKALKQAVRRNARRFPLDFMFRLSLKETRALLRSRSQIVTLNRGTNVKYAAYAFTEQGVAMLSSVLRSARAVHVNSAIMRSHGEPTGRSVSRDAAQPSVLRTYTAATTETTGPQRIRV
jgi:hypothetical protein